MKCPKCKSDLDPIGEIDFAGEPAVVYQCDTCTSEWEFEGEKFAAAVTFAVTAAGQFIDPDSREPFHLN